jgi:hypothetical protein
MKKTKANAKYDAIRGKSKQNQGGGSGSNANQGDRNNNNNNYYYYPTRPAAYLCSYCGGSYSSAPSRRPSPATLEHHCDIWRRRRRA